MFNKHRFNWPCQYGYSSTSTRPIRFLGRFVSCKRNESTINYWDIWFYSLFIIVKYIVWCEQQSYGTHCMPMIIFPVTLKWYNLKLDILEVADGFRPTTTYLGSKWRVPTNPTTCTITDIVCFDLLNQLRTCTITHLVSFDHLNQLRALSLIYIIFPSFIKLVKNAMPLKVSWYWHL
jgi:hypothetical protein